MGIKKILQEQGELYKNLTSSKTIQKYYKKTELVTLYKGRMLCKQECKAIREIEKLFGREPVVVDKPTVLWNFEISIEKNQIIYLRIFRQDIEEIPKPINNLTNLKRLELDGNKIKEIKNLDNLQKLEELSFADNEITEIKALYKLKNLKELYLDKNKIPEKEIEKLRERKVDIKIIDMEDLLKIY